MALLRALQKSELFEGQQARLLEMIEHLDETAHPCWQIPGPTHSDLGHGSWFADRKLVRSHCA